MLDTSPLCARLIELAEAAARGLPNVAGDPRAADLREAGLTSVAAVRLTPEIEAAFDFAILDADPTAGNFARLVSSEALARRLKA